LKQAKSKLEFEAQHPTNLQLGTLKNEAAAIRCTEKARPDVAKVPI